jgi:hypothetical protein
MHSLIPGASSGLPERVYGGAEWAPKPLNCSKLIYFKEQIPRGLRAQKVAKSS